MSLYSYVKTTYANSPSTTTPLNATNLNHAEDEIQALDDWVDAPKADTIAERTGAAGVTVDGVLLKDKIASVDGVKFPATQVASADANTLDDYEENTFTPAVAFGGASVGVTYSQQLGWYTKIGNRVFFNIRLTLSNKGSSAGNAQITGLPFTNSIAHGIPVTLGAMDAITFADQISALVDASGTTIALYETTNAGTRTNITNSDFTNGTILYISGEYIA